MCSASKCTSNHENKTKQKTYFKCLAMFFLRKYWSIHQSPAFACNVCLAKQSDPVRKCMLWIIVKINLYHTEINKWFIVAFCSIWRSSFYFLMIFYGNNSMFACNCKLFGLFVNRLLGITGLKKSQRAIVYETCNSRFPWFGRSLLLKLEHHWITFEDQSMPIPLW